MTETLFVSDLHLSEERPETVKLFLGFLSRRARQANHLFILGDLFDAWVGDDDDSKLASDVMNALGVLSDNGTNISFMHGNRDFLVGEEFARTTGCSLLPDPWILKTQHQNILLMHGDLLCTDDTEYQKARQLRSQPEWSQHWFQHDLQQRKAMAAAYRQQSGEAQSQVSMDILDVNTHTVEDYLHRYQVDILIHGHTHRPATHTHIVNDQEKQRIVLAEWHDNEGMALVLNAEGKFLSERILPVD